MSYLAREKLKARAERRANVGGAPPAPAGKAATPAVDADPEHADAVARTAAAEAAIEQHFAGLSPTTLLTEGGRKEFAAGISKSLGELVRAGGKAGALEATPSIEKSVRAAASSAAGDAAASRVKPIVAGGVAAAVVLSGLIAYFIGRNS